MEKIQMFYEWLVVNNKNLSDSSKYKYAHAINSINRDMLTQKVIFNNLCDMELFELDIAIMNILKSPYFIAKNKKGNQMYSNSLKQYRYYISSIQTVTFSEVVDENIIIEDKTISETEKQSIVKARRGQGKFREELMKKYDGRCIVTGVDNINLLIASHIKPWSVCDNKSRINVNNGLLLSANFDCMFDCGLISFRNNGKIIISSFLGKENEQRLHLNNEIIADLKPNQELIEFLDYHRDVLFIK